MATRARARIVDDLDCERMLLGFLDRHPRSDADALSAAFPWAKASINLLLARLAREWRVCWRLEPRPQAVNGRNPRRVYWLAPPELAQRANQAVAAERIRKALRSRPDTVDFYFHTGTPFERAGHVQCLSVAGPSIAEDGRCT